MDGLYKKFSEGIPHDVLNRIKSDPLFKADPAGGIRRILSNVDKSKMGELDKEMGSVLDLVGVFGKSTDHAKPMTNIDRALEVIQNSKALGGALKYADAEGVGIWKEYGMGVVGVVLFLAFIWVLYKILTNLDDIWFHANGLVGSYRSERFGVFNQGQRILIRQNWPNPVDQFKITTLHMLKDYFSILDVEVHREKDAPTYLTNIVTLINAGDVSLSERVTELCRKLLDFGEARFNIDDARLHENFERSRNAFYFPQFDTIVARDEQKEIPAHIVVGKGYRYNLHTEMLYILEMLPKLINDDATAREIHFAEIDAHEFLNPVIVRDPKYENMRMPELFPGKGPHIRDVIELYTAARIFFKIRAVNEVSASVFQHIKPSDGSSANPIHIARLIGEYMGGWNVNICQTIIAICLCLLFLICCYVCVVRIVGKLGETRGAHVPKLNSVYDKYTSYCHQIHPKPWFS